MAIDDIAAGGDGVGRTDGMAVFVPRTAPGDVVQVAYTSFSRHARGRLLQVLTPSAYRVVPRCHHYVNDRCGGCQLQHMEGNAQRTARQVIVRETLRRIGRRDVALPPITAGLEWGYRSRLSITLQRRRAGWVGGLHRFDDPARIFPLEHCEIAHPLLVQMWRALRPALNHPSILLPEAQELRLILRLVARRDDVARGSAAVSSEASDPVAGNFPVDCSGTCASGVGIIIQGGNAWPDLDRWTGLLHELAPTLVVCDGGVWWERSDGTIESGAAQLGDLVVTRHGARDGEGIFSGSDGVLSFAQVNKEVAVAMRAHVFSAVMQFQPSLVVDGYAGTGELSEALAGAGVKVVAVEADPLGAGRTVERLRASGVAERVEVRCDLMERAVTDLGLEQRVPDVVVLNPPRRGVDERVAGWLESAAMRSARGLIYVSCDPATLARDLARVPSWKIVSLHCFDMFPQTAHVETVCVLQRSQEREAA